MMCEGVNPVSRDCFAAVQKHYSWKYKKKGAVIKVDIPFLRSTQKSRFMSTEKELGFKVDLKDCFMLP